MESGRRQDEKDDSKQLHHSNKRVECTTSQRSKCVANDWPRQMATSAARQPSSRIRGSKPHLMRPLLRCLARPMKEEWKIRPYLGVLPLVLSALQEPVRKCSE